MPPSVQFAVPGVAQPQGSKSAYVRGGKVVVVDDNRRLAAWRQAVAWAARGAHRGAQLRGAVHVEVDFAFVRPKGTSRPSPSVRPDLDKLIRAVFDAITDAGVWHDDGQVTRLVAEERYADAPSCTVTLTQPLEKETAMTVDEMPPPMFEVTP